MPRKGASLPATTRTPAVFFAIAGTSTGSVGTFSASCAPKRGSAAAADASLAASGAIRAAFFARVAARGGTSGTSGPGDFCPGFFLPAGWTVDVTLGVRVTQSCVQIGRMTDDQPPGGGR